SSVASITGFSLTAIVPLCECRMPTTIGSGSAGSTPGCSRNALYPITPASAITEAREIHTTAAQRRDREAGADDEEPAVGQVSLLPGITVSKLAGLGVRSAVGRGAGRRE